MLQGLVSNSVTIGTTGTDFAAAAAVTAAAVTAAAVTAAAVTAAAAILQTSFRRGACLKPY